MNIRIHLMELARDLFFCGVLIAAGSGVAATSFFNSMIWLNLLAGWFIVALGLMGAVAVTVVSIMKVFELLDGWPKLFGISGAIILSAVAFTAFVVILTLQPALF